MAEYLVSLSVDLDADSPEEAAKELIKWIREEGPGEWIYSVQGMDGETVYYDGLSGRLT